MFLLIRCCIDPYISLPFSSILFTKTLILFQTMNNLFMPFCIVFLFFSLESALFSIFKIIVFGYSCTEHWRALCFWFSVIWSSLLIQVDFVMGILSRLVNKQVCQFPVSHAVVICYMTYLISYAVDWPTKNPCYIKA